MSSVKLDRLNRIVNGPADQAVQPKITCADGFSLSVQASWGHYCVPRPGFLDRSGWCGPYTAVEVGFPNDRPEPWEAWEEYAESADAPTETVYGFVPVHLVQALIESHGGER